MLNERAGNVWDVHDQYNWVVITSNGFVKRNGECVMGAGVAKEAKQRFPTVPATVGKGIKKYGNVPLFLPDKSIATFPVKHNWWEQADLELIRQSCELFKAKMTKLPKTVFHLPRPGCGNGRLTWEEVGPVLKRYFDNDPRVVIWQYGYSG